MNLWYSLQTAFGNLRANKLRSGLTMLGIIIGVSAVIMMVAILQGASARITNEFQKMGSNVIIVAYSPNREERKATARRIDGLTMDDVRAMQKECDLVKNLSPQVPLPGSSTAQFAGRNTDVTPSGVEADYARLRNVQVARGRFLSQDDLDNWAKVCVIGDKVRQELFSNEDPLGQNIDINGLNLTVVGVAAPKGRTFEGDADKNVFLPLTTVQKRYTGRENVDVIYAEPNDLAHMDQAKDQIWQVLMRRYNNLPGFRVDSMDSILNSIRQVFAIFTLVMGSIAGLALLVGGIGIMNIMLVSVTERTREIGIRKAVGAKRKDILIQFLIESATISGVGGLTGIGIGTATAYAIGYITQFIPALSNPQTGTKGMGIYVPPFFSFGAFAFSACVGIFFGIYPALRAASLDPIQALRHE
ncbi:MAG TPA: ABC transporter permease [Chthonomonadaceae bacterium]|nr:ABC transporter permease [Chthonomonadaceae bacterium]